MKNTFFLIPCLFSLQMHAQNLSGKWTGTFGNNFFSDTVMHYQFELDLKHNKKKVKGTTISYEKKGFYAKAKCVGYWDSAKQILKLIEGENITIKKVDNVRVCSMTCYLKYTIKGELEYLTGTYKSTFEDESYCGGGKVALSRKVVAYLPK